MAVQLLVDVLLHLRPIILLSPGRDEPKLHLIGSRAHDFLDHIQLRPVLELLIQLLWAILLVRLLNESLKVDELQARLGHFLLKVELKSHESTRVCHFISVEKARTSIEEATTLQDWLSLHLYELILIGLRVESEL